MRSQESTLTTCPKKWDHLTTLAAGITLYLVGFVVYGLLLMDILSTDFMKDPPVMWAIPLAQLLSGAAIATVLDWRGVSGFGDGFRGAALVGVFLSLSFSLMMYASLDIGVTVSRVLIDAVATIVVWGTAGGVVGIVHARMNRTA